MIQYFDYAHELAEQGRRTMLYTNFDEKKLSNINNMKRHQRAHDLIELINSGDYSKFTEKQMHLLRIDIGRSLNIWC